MEPGEVTVYWLSAAEGGGPPPGDPLTEERVCELGSDGQRVKSLELCLPGVLLTFISGSESRTDLLMVLMVLGTVLFV